MKQQYKTYISPYKNNCNGYDGVGDEHRGYILGVSVGIGISKSKLSHEGSSLLDEINSFDLAEVDGPYLGQLNMSIVSSFCGPQGLIWGYDIANNLVNRTKYSDLKIDKVEYSGKTIDVYNGDFLVDSLKELFGTVNKKKYNILPGSHVPFASKNIKVRIPSTIYAAIAIGIPKNRDKDACLLMEDVGLCMNKDGIDNKKEIITKLAESIIQIGINQNVEYVETMIVFKSGDVKAGETACALVAAPYFTLARNAIPTNSIGFNDFEKLLHLNLEKWRNNIK